MGNRKRKKEHSVEEDENRANEVESDPKHRRIMERYRKGVSDKEDLSDEMSNGEPGNSIQARGVLALPQPEETSINVTIPSTAGLPGWLASPTDVPASTVVRKWDSSALHLSKKMQANLSDLGFTSPLPVQASLLPKLLSKQDIWSADPYGDFYVNAPTGSGKTVAYAVPIIEILSQRVVMRLRALVIVPTRELVSQVLGTFHTVGAGFNLAIGAARGQKSFVQEQQHLSLCDVVITTPGRLVDHLNTGMVLSFLRFLVIDEADRLLQQPFQEWLPLVLSRVEDGEINAGIEVISHQCQKLAFSATLDRHLGKINSLKLKFPSLILVHDKPLATTLIDSDNEEESAVELAVPFQLNEHTITLSLNADKPVVLLNLIYKESLRRTLIFTSSGESAARLARLLDLMAEMDDMPIIKICYISGELRKSDRRRRMKAFVSGEFEIMVCTDVIGRGMDAPVYHVVNYDAPKTARTYVHRVGRTARVDRPGSAWTLVEHFERKRVSKLLKQISRGKTVARSKAPIDINAHYERALEKLQSEAAWQSQQRKRANSPK